MDLITLGVAKKYTEKRIKEMHPTNVDLQDYISKEELEAYGGLLENLSTEEKNNLVAAINEIKTSLDGKKCSVVLMETSAYISQNQLINLDMSKIKSEMQKRLGELVIFCFYSITNSNNLMAVFCDEIYKPYGQVGSASHIAPGFVINGSTMYGWNLRIKYSTATGNYSSFTSVTFTTNSLTKIATSTDVTNIKIQYSSMPTATSSNVGKIVQYIGSNTNEYTNGYFYQVVSEISTDETGAETTIYNWSPVNVMATNTSEVDLTSYYTKEEIDTNLGNVIIVPIITYSSSGDKLQENLDAIQRILPLIKEKDVILRVVERDNANYEGMQHRLFFLSPAEYNKVTDIATYTGTLTWHSELEHTIQTLDNTFYDTKTVTNLSVNIENGVVISLDGTQGGSRSNQYNTELAILGKYNKKAYTPTGDYHPATKKYVDDSVAAIRTPKSHDGEGMIGWYGTAVAGDNLTELYGVTPDMVRAVKAGDYISWPSRVQTRATENTICLYNMTYEVYNKDEGDYLETIDIKIGKSPDAIYTYVIVGDNVYKETF